MLQGDESGKVFISYRREDSTPYTDRIYDELVPNFGRETVFKDVDSLWLARDFAQDIQQAIKQSAVMIVVIGPSWLRIQDAHGNMRLENADDPVREELETALNEGVPILPLLVGDAHMPELREFPSGLEGVHRYGGMAVRNDPDFHHDMDKVIARIKQLRSEHKEKQPRAELEETEAKKETGGEQSGKDPSPRLQNYPVEVTKRLGIQRTFVNTPMKVAILLAVILSAGGWTAIQLLSRLNQPNERYQYIAAVPGPACDHGRANWVVVHGLLNCFPNSTKPDRVHLATRPGEGIAQIYFFGTQQLPNNYRISVDIDSESLGACAGIVTRNSNSRLGGYGFEVCDDGSWLITKYDAGPGGTSEQVSNLKASTDLNKASPATTYHLTAITDGTTLHLTINDQTDETIQDTENATTDSVSLFVAPAGTSQGSANFADFTFQEIRP